MLLSLSSQNPTPLYAQIVDQVRAKILSGELAPGALLPSIRQLAAELTTSVITTKRAYLELEREGLIVTRPGTGTFVAALDREALRAARVRALEAELRAWVRRARAGGLGTSEIESLLDAAKKRGWTDDGPD